MLRSATKAPLLLALFPLLGCSDETAEPAPMGFDGGFVPRANDEDGDGVCNEAEPDFGADPANPDTDGDEYPDGLEILFGFDPVLAAVPDRDHVLFLRENPASGTQVAITAEVDGEGEDYTGAFEALEAIDEFGLRADAFHAGSAALFANPDFHVGLVDQERFRGVVGTTRLVFEVRFAFGDVTPRLCLRGYPFRYTVKSSTGDVSRSGTYLLVVLPVGQDLGTGTWCNVPDPCFR